MIIKGYSDGPFGQIHWRLFHPEEAPEKPDLYCLHPAPFSGLAFTTIMPFLARGRRVIAPDYPGYGGSDPFIGTPSINDYAQAICRLADELSPHNQIDLMGFHTGCLVAVECALSDMASIRRLALIDVPAFDAETRARYLPVMGSEFDITPELQCLEKPWDLGITKRIESQGTDRSFEMFTEQLRPGSKMNSAFHAAFSYDVEGRLPKVTHTSLILASQSALLDPSRRAADLIAGAWLVERLDIKRSVLDEAAALTATEVLTFLGV